jgi:hypothetical protein
MQLWQHFENFKRGRIFSVDMNTKYLTVDGRCGTYTYVIHTGELFWNDGNNTQDITGITIRNLSTEQYLTLDPYPLKIGGMINYVSVYQWSEWLKNLPIQDMFAPKPRPCSSIFDIIDNI